VSDDTERPITVGDLIGHLKQFDAGLPVIYECFSDYALLELKEVRVVKAVPKSHWVMRAYPEHEATMSEENRKAARQFLCFPGN